MLEWELACRRGLEQADTLVWEQVCKIGQELDGRLVWRQACMMLLLAYMLGQAYKMGQDGK